MKLGEDRGMVISDGGRRAAAKTRTARAEARAADLAPLIAELQAQGVTTLRDIAKALNERGIPTARGKEWAPEQVRRILAKL